jgi:hypothetical protein
MTAEELIRLVETMRDALRANQVFHTPLARRRRGGEWSEYELDAIHRTRDAIAASAAIAEHGNIEAVEA